MLVTIKWNKEVFENVQLELDLGVGNYHIPFYFLPVTIYFLCYDL